jgi:hypothetical protein
MRRSAAQWAAVLGLGLWLGAATAARAEFVTYHVDVNTSALSGQSGSLDFQLNPGAGSAQAATATVTQFLSAGGSPAPSASLSGDATGLLPGTLTLGNSTAFNDVFQGFTFGSGFSFDLSLSGAALDHPGGTFGSSFALSLYNAAGDTPLLTTDPNGSVLTVNLSAAGATSVQTFSQSLTSSTPAAHVGPVTNLPEPSSLLLLAAAIPGWLIALPHWRRRAKQVRGAVRR